MNSTPWIPKNTFYLENLLETKALGEIKVGTSADKIEALLGRPELPNAKLSPKSKIWVSLYGNVNLLIADNRVIGINVDFHGNRTEMLLKNSIKNWKLPEWKKFAEKNNWNLKQIFDVLKIEGEGITIGLNPNGIINMVSVH